MSSLLCLFWAAQSSDPVNADEEKSSTDTPTVKPEFTSTVSACATTETDIASHHVQEPDIGSDILDGLTVRLIKTDRDSHMQIKPASSFDRSPNAEFSENCTTDAFISLSHSPSSEALDLTDSARKQTNTATKRKLDVSNHAVTSKEVRLDELQAHDDYIDNCSESSSVVCVKDEILTSADIGLDRDWSASLSASIPLQGNCLSNPSCHKASIPLDNANGSNSVSEELSNVSSFQSSDQVFSLICLLLTVTY